jgi:monoterpene epsilon-lactone hydrolase
MFADTADLAGLPPTLIQSGTADLLISDCRKFQQKCIASVMDVKYEEYADGLHDFMMLNALPETKKAIASQADFLCS